MSLSSGDVNNVALMKDSEANYKDDAHAASFTFKGNVSIINSGGHHVA